MRASIREALKRKLTVPSWGYNEFETIAGDPAGMSDGPLYPSMWALDLPRDLRRTVPPLPRLRCEGPIESDFYPRLGLRCEAPGLFPAGAADAVIPNQGDDDGSAREGRPQPRP